MGHAHLYDRRWRKRRARQLREEPTCRMCRELFDRITEATVADHIEPHRGDPVKFRNGALQSLCQPCHDVRKAQLEKSGHIRGHDARGVPIGNSEWRRVYGEKP